MKKSNYLSLRLLSSRVITGVFVLLLSSQLFGQKELFETTTRDEIGFTKEQGEKLDNMIKNPIYLDHYFVKINDILSVQFNGILNVNLPDQENSELFYDQNIKFVNSKNFVYYGTTDPCDEAGMGYFHLIEKNGNIFGQINIENEIYEIQDFGNHKNVIFKIDPKIYTESSCATESKTIKDKIIDSPHNNNKSSICYDVRILVVYTNAAEMVGNPDDKAELFIEQSNQIANNSQAVVRFSLAGVVKLDDFEESSTMALTRNNLRLNGDVDDLRELHQADIVVLLTDGNWLLDGAKVNGIAYLDNWGDPNFGYVVTEIDASNGNYTFTHEVAHTFGCKHEVDNRGAPNFVHDARGHNFNTGTKWYQKKRRRRTIMNTSSSGNKIMHFSNPDIKFKGKRTGVYDSKENADHLTLMACDVAAYRDYIPDLGVNINGPIWGSNSGSFTWCASIQGCDNPSSITWEYSTDGFNYNNWLVNEVCKTASLPLDQSIYIRVTVVCNDGQTATDWIYVYNEDEDDFCGPKFNDPGNEIPDVSLKNIQSSKNLTIFPNPVINSINLELEIQKPGIINIQLMDLSGNQVKLFKFDYIKSGKFSETYDISDILSGYYFIEVEIEDEIQTKSIIKI